MPTATECLCCCEIDEVNQRKKESFDGSEPKCITEHESFESVCLDIWVLQTAYFAYRHHYGDLDSTTHE